MTETAEQDKVEDTEVQKDTLNDLFEEPESKDKETKVETKTETTGDEKPPEKTDKEAETTTAEETVPVKALTEERRKRQEAEKKAQELEAKLKEPEATKVPDPVEDPEGYARFMEDKTNLDALRIKVNLSRDMMLDVKQDYAEKEQVFVELAKKNPYLVQQMNASPNPAKYAYQTAEEHLAAKQAPIDLENSKKKIAELEAEIIQLKSGKKPDKKSALDMPDLMQATAAGKNSDKAVPEATLNDILEDAPLDKRSYK